MGSACSIVISKGIEALDQMSPGMVKAVHLVVGDVSQAREMLLSKGVQVGDVMDHGGGVKSAGLAILINHNCARVTQSGDTSTSLW